MYFRHTSILAWVASAVINILVTILSIESWLTVALVSPSVVDTSSIRMTRFFSFTFINVLIACCSSVSRSSTITSEVVNSINARACSTRKSCTVVYIFITCLSLEPLAKKWIIKLLIIITKKLPNHWWTPWYYFRDTIGYHSNAMTC